ncbi:DUF7344 domain-containing protein [Haloarcula nitratireducens]|uniref:DUF7344 domain-containing protein n=1 Tax=Haloarcula nitratireducens TaxID=2487749 RepID=UPI003CCBB98D
MYPFKMYTLLRRAVFYGDVHLRDMSDGGNDDCRDDSQGPHSRCGDDESHSNRFELLANKRRRSILSYLQSVDDDMVKLPELTELLAEQAVKCDSDRYESIAISLHHTHLPKLAENEFLEYDTQCRTIRYHGHSSLERLLMPHDKTGGDNL